LFWSVAWSVTPQVQFQCHKVSQGYTKAWL
jgi:hypothetical protein